MDQEEEMSPAEEEGGEQQEQEPERGTVMSIGFERGGK